MKLVGGINENRILIFWFAYRYLYRRPYLLCENERYRLFFQRLDNYFLEKYKLKTVEETRHGIEQMFDYESERPLIMNEEVINALIDSVEN